MSDDPEQPPGARNLVRIFAETLHAHDDALSAGDGLSARLTPQHWNGPAREAFVGIGLSTLDTEWQKIADINRAAAARMAAHKVFLYNLRELWSVYSNDPAERARLRALWEQETAKIARELAAWSGELDRLGYFDFGNRPAAPAPEMIAGPMPHRVLPSPPRPAPEPAAEPDWQQAAAMLTQSFRVAIRLRQQVLTGERQDHIPWTA